ncbi:hypothetical protein DRQ53_07140 [bacterium]|nr:MAG: hypothetical protein DRQ53_07140 [bacterium]
MAEHEFFGDAETRFLQELSRHDVAFMIVGLSAAALQGAPVVTQDVDLWFRELPNPGLEEVLRELHGVYVPPTMATPPMIGGEGIELFDLVTRMDGLESFDDELSRTVPLRLGRFVVRILSLERIIASKREANREKDRLVLRVLEDALATIRAREEGSDEGNDGEKDHPG